METYIFHREEGWYPLELANDKEAIANAKHNPGTIKVEKIRGRKTKEVWNISKH